MTFENLHGDTNCDCIADAKEDFESTFGLKTNKNHLREVDFNSNWEKGKKPETSECDETCSHKGKSISLVDERNIDAVLSIFQGLFPLSPSYKPYFTTVKFSNETGVVKATPNFMNQYHYDFYKCDNFIFSNVKQLNSVPISENV